MSYEPNSRTITYMSMLRGSPRDRNSEQNLLVEVKELRSIPNTIMSALGDSLRIFSFTSSALLRFLAGITILTPLFASTLAVSAPIPEVAPARGINFCSCLVLEYNPRESNLKNILYHAVQNKAEKRNACA